MDALPGTPQIQNIIPTTFFGTDDLGGAVARLHRRVFILAAGMSYLEWQPPRGAGAQARATAPTCSTSRSRSTETAWPTR